MRLVELAAQNYRTLTDFKLRFPNGYCTISGKNNAGKSSIIRLLSNLFGQGNAHLWRPAAELDFKEDRTQWAKSAKTIRVSYTVLLSRDDDPALLSFIERVTGSEVGQSTSTLAIEHTVDELGSLTTSLAIDQRRIEEAAAKDIISKIKESQLLFLHNSTTDRDQMYFGYRGRRASFFEMVMSGAERKEIEAATNSVQRRLRRLARQHRDSLNTILGRLSERFDVELAPPESLSMGHLPIGINLKDRHVEVPLTDWGSGTQNRTQILMSILQASRIKLNASPVDKITPIVVIEEPESFLHPSAQAEFGRVLLTLAKEFGVQTIATSHSPYMLNREDPAANTLLCRQHRRGKAYETKLVDTSGDGWMSPFAEHLGIDPSDFLGWRQIFSSYRSNVLLVEGDTDRDYFEHLKTDGVPADARLRSDIEVVGYGGKDTLKNTLLLKFVLSHFDRVFITYDLDADQELRAPLGRLGLSYGKEFLSLGLPSPGKDCIEGLLPTTIVTSVIAANTDLIMALSSDAKARKDAKEALKRKYLEAFRSRRQYSSDEIVHLRRVVRQINERFSSKGARRA